MKRKRRRNTSRDTHQLVAPLTGRFRKVPLWLLPLGLAIVTFLNFNLHVTSDLAWYLNSALNLATGNGYLNLDHSIILKRPPGFPLLIAGAFALLGAAVSSAYWVIRLFAIANPVLIYAAGEKLFSKWTGLVASLMYLTSFTVNHWSFRHLDHIWPFFALLGMLLVYLAFERQSSWKAVGGGLCLGLAFLVKELAIVFLAFPPILFVISRPYRHKQQVYRVVLATAAFLAIVVPWALYIVSQTGNFSLLLGASGSTASQTFLSGGDASSGGINLWAGIATFAEGLYHYVLGTGLRNSLIQNFLLTPLFIAAWGYALIKALRRSRPHAVLVLGAVLISPLLAYAGLKDLRIGQTVFFFMVTYLATANAICALGTYLPSIINRYIMKLGQQQRSAVRAVATAVIVLVCIGLQMGADVSERSNIAFLRQSVPFKALTGGDTSISLGGKFTPASRQMGTWIAENLDPDAKLMTASRSMSSAFHFYANAAHPIYSMPALSSRDQKVTSRNDGQVIFVSSWIPRVDPKNRFMALREEDLYREIENRGVTHVLSGRRRNYLGLFFEAHPDFNKLTEFGNGETKIFEVQEPVSAGEFDPFVTVRAVQYLNNLEAQNPDKYQEVVQNFFQTELGWTIDQVEKLQQGNYGTIVRKWKTY